MSVFNASVLLLTMNFVNIVKVVCGSGLSAVASWIHSYFDNVMTKLVINNRRDAWKTDVNLLTCARKRMRKITSGVLLYF